jgi:hypothetical protein
LPRHARPLPAGRWAGRMADRGLVRLPTDAEAARPAARRDQLLDPLAIAEHCVIGDQIRVPTTCCDFLGCGVEFADPAALGEADNRARALVAGWRTDAFGRLLCPGCQELHGVRWPWIPGPEPEAGGGPTPATVPPGPRDGGSPSAQAKSPFMLAKVAGARGVISHGRHRMTGWLHMLTALASGNNGWSVTQPSTGPPLERDDTGPQAGAA